MHVYFPLRKQKWLMLSVFCSVYIFFWGKNGIWCSENQVDGFNIYTLSWYNFRKSKSLSSVDFMFLIWILSYGLAVFTFAVTFYNFSFLHSPGFWVWETPQVLQALIFQDNRWTKLWLWIFCVQKIGHIVEKSQVEILKTA